MVGFVIMVGFGGIDNYGGIWLHDGGIVVGCGGL